LEFDVNKASRQPPGNNVTSRFSRSGLGDPA
jgi:hypothetical protein